MRHLIISFGSEGALWVNNTGSGATTALYMIRPVLKENGAKNMMGGPSATSPVSPPVS